MLPNYVQRRLEHLTMRAGGWSCPGRVPDGYIYVCRQLEFSGQMVGREASPLSTSDTAGTMGSWSSDAVGRVADTVRR